MSPCLCYVVAIRYIGESELTASLSIVVCKSLGRSESPRKVDVILSKMISLVKLINIDITVLLEQF